jgi:hypothetical protein
MREGLKLGRGVEGGEADRLGVSQKGSVDPAAQDESLAKLLVNGSWAGARGLERKEVFLRRIGPGPDAGVLGGKQLSNCDRSAISQGL